ncbi:vascular endothelial growth factor receptor 1-like [Neodiprion pinetum]|uniref:vascular endothelial growth factor receptor 1-like n=1 Tax=Neodiprion pinetum TaxID=441929 RepID=UPI001EDD9953|nr:hemicentin-2-like [Neodiprion pinetum]
MERIGSTWALSALAVSALFLGITARKPTMIPAKAEFLIQEGDDLIISCRGDGDIQFSFMDTPYHDLHWYYNIKFDENAGLHTFTRPNAVSKDTGWYACAYEGIEIKNDAQTIEHPDENITWIYVYVNSSSPFAQDALYDHSLIQFIGQKTGGSLVIPCRLNSPKKQSVYLRHYSRLNMRLSTQSFQYEPKIGFIKHNVSDSMSGTYLCHTSHRHHYSEANWYFPTMLTYEVLIGDLVEPMPPLIDKDEFRGLEWGQNHTFNCHSEDDVDELLRVEWKVPYTVPRERLRQIHNDEMQAAQLTLFNAQESDRGDYTCTKIKRYVKSSVTIHVEFHDPDVTYINVTASSGNGSFVTVAEKTTAIWNLSIDTYPKAYTVKWIGKDKLPIANSGKYLHTQSGTDNTFKIFHATIADIGVYTLRISTLNDTKDHNLELTVLAQPVVRIVNSVSYHTPGQPATFSCSATGSPLPNITWKYLEYPDFPSKTVSKYASVSEIRYETSRFFSFHILSHSTIRINATGDLTCRSCNVVGCSEAVEPIFVSDANGYFGVMDPGTVVEGDTINLTCGASAYNFTNNIAWEVNNSTEHERLSITNRTTKFTFQSILQISDVKKSDSGEYVCRAVNKDNHNTTAVSYELSVMDARVPSINDESTTNNTEIEIDLINDEHAKVRLTCFADGMPNPEVTWLKDGKPLIKHSEQYAISQNNSELYIKYFRGSADGGNYSCQAKNRVGTIERYMNIIITVEQSNYEIIWIGLVCVLSAILVALLIYTTLKVKRAKHLKKEFRRMALSELDQRPSEDSVNDEDELISNNQESPRDRLIGM